MRESETSMDFPKQWRIVPTNGMGGGPVIFDSEDEMRRQAPQVARFAGSDVTLFRPDDELGFVPIDTVKWDGLPDVNETIEVVVTFTATVTTRVRRFNDSGKERDLGEAVQHQVLDVLQNELCYEQPEPHDTIEGPGDATVENFVVVSATPVATAST